MGAFFLGLSFRRKNKGIVKIEQAHHGEKPELDGSTSRQELIGQHIREGWPACPELAACDLPNAELPAKSGCTELSAKARCTELPAESRHVELDVDEKSM